MLHITFCPKKNSEITIENDCESCPFYYHFDGYFGCDWFECVYDYFLEMTKEEYLYLIERLKIGL